MDLYWAFRTTINAVKRFFFYFDFHEDSVHVCCRMMTRAVSLFQIVGIILEISCVTGKTIK